MECLEFCGYSKFWFTGAQDLRARYMLSIRNSDYLHNRSVIPAAKCPIWPSEHWVSMRKAQDLQFLNNDGSGKCAHLVPVVTARDKTHLSSQPYLYVWPGGYQVGYR